MPPIDLSSSWTSWAAEPAPLTEWRLLRAVIEYIHNRIGARTLFSTHFHELTKLEQSLPNLATYRVEVEEKMERCIFSIMLPGAALTKLRRQRRPYGRHT